LVKAVVVGLVGAVVGWAEVAATAVVGWVVV
jgi:hypothetical protein